MSGLKAQLFLQKLSSGRVLTERLPGKESRAIERFLQSFMVITIVGSMIAVSVLDSSAQTQNHFFLEKTASSNSMVGTFADKEKAASPAPFYEGLRKALKKRKTKIENICPIADSVSRRILEEYGAMFLAVKKVTPPPICVFTNEDQVTTFQEQAGSAKETIADAEIELQPEAMKALMKAREKAQKEDLDITPRGGAEAARRNYADSLRLWDTRFLPALDYWLGQGRLTSEQVTRLQSLPLHAQVAEVLELEKNGIFFSKDLSKSILYSIAAPGTSQHIAMLALDVTEFDNPRVREILAKHGWFQTVLSDLPHFTFLGLKEKDLPKHGLKSVEADGQTFWVPNVSQPGWDLRRTEPRAVERCVKTQESERS